MWVWDCCIFFYLEYIDWGSFKWLKIHLVHSVEIHCIILHVSHLSSEKSVHCAFLKIGLYIYIVNFSVTW